jgi:hypothetical protein
METGGVSLLRLIDVEKMIGADLVARATQNYSVEQNVLTLVGSNLAVGQSIERHAAARDLLEVVVAHPKMTALATHCDSRGQQTVRRIRFFGREANHFDGVLFHLNANSVAQHDGASGKN